MNPKEIKNKFIELFGEQPLLVRSPGRINLIGEHTDYNDGYVFPAAINKEIHFAVGRNDLKRFRFYANDLREHFELNVEDLKPTQTQWANYLLGVAAQYQKAGLEISGIDCVFGGDIPMGAGLSSSAAMENGFAFAISQLFDIAIKKIDMVKMAQKAEHEYAGVMCGIMDQFASMHGKSGHALKLDCKNLDFEYAKIDLKGYKIVLCDTKVKHELASSEYNTRRKECEACVQILQKYHEPVLSLRDVSLDLLMKYENEFDTTSFRRCKYVIEENLRVKAAFDALQNNDIAKLGKLMFETHVGLRDEYGVSCEELDILVAFAKSSSEVVGARMMGGGFGGCTINIVKEKSVSSFAKNILRFYLEETGVEAEIYFVNIADGTGLVVE